MVKIKNMPGKMAVAPMPEDRAYPSTKAALAAIADAVAPFGYTKVKIADDDHDTDEFRVVATTPGGRAGRNVAYIYDLNEYFE